MAIKYKDGLMFAADCLSSYGSLMRFKNARRLYKLGESTLIGASGDMSDFQYMQEKLEELMNKERNWEDDQVVGTKSIYSLMQAMLYNRRSNINPLWNSYIVGGKDKGEFFLGYVDMYGTTFQSASVSTGLGKHYAQPIMRKALETKGEDMSEDEAREVLLQCLRVLYYRDTRSLNVYQIGKVTDGGVEISEPLHLDSDWEFGRNVRGYGL
ncbi:Proteasome subunit beta type-7 [Spiromyces aspiralis]|uniref:Proteasome subunit beta type-7 n=1 Tax=Spiromyces aspiralis TaxID=68401 RepID=A0ACC1HRY7_9FUNG|nr:Proteasome subunit beta type-7 [Spiromyces aspiralis]